MKIRRATVGHSIVVGLVAAVVAALIPATTWAHGALLTPGSRTYLCYKDGLTSTGEIKPTNPACQNALAVGGAQPFYDWYGVLRSDGAGRTTGFIPDGSLCSGGFTKYAGFDAPRNDWPLTHLTSGAPFNWTYAAWAAHPGWFYLYVTKDGYNPNQALTWADMESTPFLSVDHPPLNGSAPTGNYYWSGNLPNKTGRHVIYSVWKRSDSTETFYGCSDVVFDGGNGEVTGIGGGTNPSPSPSVTTSSSPSASPSASASVSPTASTPAPSGACSATYSIVNSWGGGFQGEVVVKAGSAAVNGWTLKWTFANGQTISQLWNGTLTASGASVTVKPVSWNTSIPANGSVSVGFLASQSGTNAVPTVSCTSP
ncbi:lytic polysaccharide monooxygenase [Hamadaea sp. NPDC050747]|uniref:lytic polysaccharide monooxygenase auxiliary activity family 9 protein n=1 Tax=Hamadaea sp. NPDC050747 TaxID=3155789 RepID=UPI0033C0D189